MHEPWTSRRFAFDHPVERLPVFLDRIRGAPDRIEAKLRGVPHSTLAARRAGTWSILENIGHLADLESLHLRRLEELAAGATALSAADLDNRATWDANHNEQTLAAVLARLRSGRQHLLSRLETWDPTQLGFAAFHPRLKMPMRVVDVAFFAAEHDDYHIARIAELLKLAGPPPAAEARAARWTDLPHDAPMPGIERNRIIGEMAMISRVLLRKGTVVPVHQHANEQFSSLLSGRVRFTLRDRTCDVAAGEVIHFPSGVPHGAEALEECEILDMFAPPSATTGIDQR